MKTNKLFAILLCVACSIGLYSCSDDDAKQPLANPTVNVAGTSYQSLTFSWDAIPNAVQYGYRLSDETNEYSKAGVSKTTQVKFTGLNPSTTYTLEVWAFAAIDGDYSTPPAVTLTATTDAVIKLSTPEITVDIKTKTTTISWTSVDKAENYTYQLTGPGNTVVSSGTTTKTSVSFRGLAGGNYQFTVMANSSVGGYIASDVATATFQIEGGEAELDIETLPGVYAIHIYGYNATSSTPEDFDYEFDDEEDGARIIFEGDNMISIDDLWWSECPIFGSVDSKKRTITFEAQDYYVYSSGAKYVFASKDDVNGDVMAQVNVDGSITMDNFGLWKVQKDGTVKGIELYASTVLTKLSSASKPSNPKKAKKPSKIAKEK